MATRYLTIWSATALPADLLMDIERQIKLTHLTISPGLHLFTDSDEMLVHIDEGDGVVVGKVFSRTDPPCRVKRIRGYADGLHRSADRVRFTRDFWGEFVSFTVDQRQETTCILRDPSGGVPCYYLEGGNFIALTSEINLLIGAGLLTPEIDWPSILSDLYLPALPSARTCLKGVSELLAGTCLVASASRVEVAPFWTPWDYVSSNTFLNKIEFLDQFRSTIRSTIGALGGASGRVLLGVSGGLDSSIIAASLSGSDVDVACYTMATAEPEGDERPYARAVCEKFNLPLTEAFHQSADVEIFRPSSTHLPRPRGVCYAQSLVKTQDRIAEDLNIDTVFNGYGGDNVFCLMQSATPLLDRVRQEGIGFGAFATLNDISKLTSASLWDILSAALSRAMRNERYCWPIDSQFLAHQSLEKTPFAPSHAWLNAPPHAYAGKAAHIAKLVGAHSFLESASIKFQGAHVNPLLAQPIVELCLAIPTWMWCEDGQNRSIARQAFAGTLPPAIIERVSKGGPSSFAYNIIENNRRRMQEFLLTGQLSREGLVDLAALRNTFDNPRPLRIEDYTRLAVLFEAELWSRHWIDRSRSRAAVRPLLMTRARHW